MEVEWWRRPALGSVEGCIIDKWVGRDLVSVQSSEGLVDRRPIDEGIVVGQGITFWNRGSMTDGEEMGV